MTDDVQVLRQTQRAHADDGVRPWVRRNPLWRLKLRLQFTGWLQYVAPAGPALLLLGSALVAAPLGVAPVLWWRSPRAWA